MSTIGVTHKQCKMMSSSYWKTDLLKAFQLIFQAHTFVLPCFIQGLNLRIVCPIVIQCHADL